MQPILPGLLACAALAALAFGVSVGLPALGSATGALLLGIVAGGTLRANRRTAPGVKWTAKVALAATIVALGFGVDPSVLVSAGASRVLMLIAVVAGTTAAGALIGRALGLSRGLALLVGIGNGVCGTAAIAAAAPVVQEDAAESGVAIGVIHALGLIGLVAVPALATALGFSEVDQGLLVGSTLQALGHVVAAGYTLGEVAGDTATAVKLARVALLVPLVLVLSAVRGRRGQLAVPWELVGFCVAAVAVGFGAVPPSGLAVMKTVATALLAIAMAGIGAGIDLGVLKTAAPRALLAGALTFGLQVVGVAVWLWLW